MSPAGRRGATSRSAAAPAAPFKGRTGSIPPASLPRTLRGVFCSCERGDSNPHGARPHEILSLARLPSESLSRGARRRITDNPLSQCKQSCKQKASCRCHNQPNRLWLPFTSDPADYTRSSTTATALRHESSSRSARLTIPKLGNGSPTSSVHTRTATSILGRMILSRTIPTKEKGRREALRLLWRRPLRRSAGRRSDRGGRSPRSENTGRFGTYLRDTSSPKSWTNLNTSRSRSSFTTRQCRTTQDCRYRHVGAVLRWCDYENVIDRVEKPRTGDKLPKAVREDELRSICREAVKDYRKKRRSGYCRPREIVWIVPAIRFAYLTGLRGSELARVRWRHVDLERQQLTIRKQKSGNESTIPLVEPARELLRALHDGEIPSYSVRPVVTLRSGQRDVFESTSAGGLLHGGIRRASGRN